MSQKTLYLIDGHSYIYRAFYAIRNLSTSKGFPTNAVHGFTAMLMKVVGEKKPDYLAVCFDPKGPTTRHTMYEEYKATRPMMPEALIPQIPYIQKVVEAFNIPVLVIDRMEADDVIAALSRKASKEGFDVTIVSGDKDLFQLIDGNIKIYDTMKDEMYGREQCIGKFGVPPEKIPDLLGLAGDTSDNIPGVPGIGPKTAVQLITEYGSVEEVLANADKIAKPKLRESLTAHAEDARLSKKLVQLMDYLPEPVEMESLLRREQHSRELIELFKELEFTALLKYVSHEEKHECEFITVRTEAALKKLVAEIRRAGAVAIDTEASSPLPMWGEPVGIGLCIDADKSYYVPFGHEIAGGGLFPSHAEGQLDARVALGLLGPVLEDGGIKKYGHNIKTDIITLAGVGIKLAGVSFDTMVGSYLLNPGRTNHNIENVALEHLSHKKMTMGEAAGTGQKQVGFALLDIGTATRYSAENAWISWQLSGLLTERLRQEELLGLFTEIELPLIFVLADIEANGFFVDGDYLAGMGKELEITLEGIVSRIFMLAGEEFNINSPKQLATVLFEKLNLPPVKKTKSGYSTNEEVLTVLAASHELPAEILNYRELFKLKSTYVDALQRLVNPRTGRVHTTLNQAVTATGRLSSSEPNLQNIPIRGEIGRRIRKAFAAERGNLIVSADYSQIELRIMAHLARDESFIESFKNDEDIHTRTAAEIFGLPPDRVTQDMRRSAKAINFGIIYGLSAFGLSGQIGVHPREAQKYIDAYFSRHIGVKKFIENTLVEVREKGYATTIFGRKRPIPEILSGNKTVASQGERIAVNTPIQGSAADIIKVAMINIAHIFRQEGLKTRMILQVHDELVFEAPESELDRVREIVRSEMEGVIRLEVPIKVDMGSGPDWGEAH
jgi:DNA polymerase I